MSTWQPIETALKDCEFLAYGSYLYPGDKDITDYIMIAELSGGVNWPYRTGEGLHYPEFFTHWMPLPPKPEGES